MAEMCPSGYVSAMESVSQFARRAGVTPRAVRARIARGSLDARLEGGRWFVTEHADAAPRHRGRRLTSASFDRLAAYADGDTGLLTPDEKRRARERMERMRTGGVDAVQTYARRSDMVTEHFHATAADLEELRHEPSLALTGVSSQLSEVYGPVIDAYVGPADASRLALFHVLEPVSPGEQNVQFRVVPRPPKVRRLHVLADLLDDRHARSRAEAARLLSEILS